MEAQWKANVCGPEWEGNHKERTENKKEKHFSSLSSYGSHVVDEQSFFDAVEPKAVMSRIFGNSLKR